MPIQSGGERKLMAYIRDQVQQSPTLEYFQQRLAAGWKLRAVEWEKEDTPGTAVSTAERHEPPYGTEVAPEGLHLQSNTQEILVLLTILEMIVAEKNISLIADELNLRGYRMRQGAAWNASAVFNLLPRIVEMGPTMLKSADWVQRRPHIQPPQ